MTARWIVGSVLALGALTACGGDDRPAASTRGEASPAGPVAAAPAGPAASVEPRAAIFVEKGCPQCHSISALGVKSPAEIGPDLTLAYEDVQTRFNMKLAEFLEHPTGTMQVVLGSQIQLSPAERDSIVRILTGLHEEMEEEDEDEDDEEHEAGEKE